MSGVHHCRFRFGQMFIDRHNLITTTSFEPVSPIGTACTKNFASSRAEMCGAAPFLLICATQCIFLDQMGEKTLNKVLRFR